MNQELKDRWVTALLSDKYTQGRGRLQTNDNKFCCLGVLCDILQPEGWIEEPSDEDEDGNPLNRMYYQDQFASGASDAIFSDKDGELLPLSLTYELDFPRALQSKLAEQNDNGEGGFEQIVKILKTMDISHQAWAGLLETDSEYSVQELEHFKKYNEEKQLVRPQVP